MNVKAEGGAAGPSHSTQTMVVLDSPLYCFELCFCGWSGPQRNDPDAARADGREHIDEVKR